MRLGKLGMVAALAAAIPLLLVSGCGSTSTTSTTKHFTVGLLNGDNIDPYFLSIWKGALAQATSDHVTLKEVAPATFDAEEEVPLLNDLISEKVNAILLSADGNLPPFLAGLKAAAAAKIPVIIINESEADMSNTKYALSFITSGNTDLGLAAGKAMVAALGGKGTVGVIDSTPGLTSNLHRAAGFVTAATQGGLTTLPQQFSHDSITTADSIATDLLSSNPGLAGIFAVDSFTSQGVGTAVKALGKTGTVKVVGIDAEPQEVALLKAGVMQALVAQKPYYVGQLAMKYAVDALTGKKSEIVRSVNPGDIVLTPSNINDPKYANVPYSSTAP